MNLPYLLIDAECMYTVSKEETNNQSRFYVTRECPAEPPQQSLSDRSSLPVSTNVAALRRHEDSVYLLQGLTIHPTTGNSFFWMVNAPLFLASRTEQADIRKWEVGRRLLFRGDTIYFCIRLGPVLAQGEPASAVDFTLQDRDRGAVAGILDRGGLIFFFRFRFVGEFDLKKEDVELVGRMAGGMMVPAAGWEAEELLEEFGRLPDVNWSPEWQIYLTADQTILIFDGRDLLRFRRAGDTWQQDTTAREVFSPVGRIWDRRTDEDILVGSEGELLRIGRVTPGRSATLELIEAPRASELRALWTATRTPATLPASP